MGAKSKEELIKFMHASGFDWIEDIAYINGYELVASKLKDSEELWWRAIQVEGSGFERLFRGSVREVCKLDGR